MSRIIKQIRNNEACTFRLPHKENRCNKHLEISPSYIRPVISPRQGAFWLCKSRKVDRSQTRYSHPGMGDQRYPLGVLGSVLYTKTEKKI